MKVLLIKNYAPDQQRSMLAFADMLAEGLTDQGCEVKIVQPTARLGNGRNTNSGLGKWLGYFDKYLLARNDFKRSEREFQPDIVHVCDHSNAMYLPLFQCPTLLTCHDLLAVRVWLGEIPGEAKAFFGAQQQKWILANIRRAQAIACISDTTQDDLIRIAPKTKPCTSVIPMGLNFPYQVIDNNVAEDRIQAHGGITSLAGTKLMGPWILHVGNDGWYKNRLGAVRIWKNARTHTSNDYGMVFVGETPNEEMAKELHGLESSVAFIQGASNELLEALYCKAKCLLFPSLAEGYGWPPIEAQACGCPVVVSDVEPLRGNCQGALLIDPNNEAQSGRQLASILSNDSALEKMATDGVQNAQRFTARKMIEAYIELYRRQIAQA